MTSRQIKSKLYELFGIDCSVSTEVDYENDLTFVSAILTRPMPALLEIEISNTIVNNELDTDITLIPHPHGVRVKLTINEWADLLSGFDRPRGRTLNPRHIGFASHSNEPIPPCSNCKIEKTPEVSFMIGADSKYYCEQCAKKLFVQCRNCGGVEIKEKYKACDVCELKTCSNCGKKHPCSLLEEEEKIERRGIYALAKKQKFPIYELDRPFRDLNRKFYDGSIEATKYIKHTRYVGTEIEIEQGERFGIGFLMPKEVGLAHDGSLDEKTGLEIQTPPASGHRLEEFVGESCRILKRRKYKATKTCGLHVHLDARDFKTSSKKIVQVIKTFFAIEDMIFSMLPPSRWASKFCQKLSKDYLYETFSNKIKADVAWYKDDNRATLSDRKGHKYDKARYYGLNAHSIFHRGTLELRYHSGTISERKILNWASFCLYILEYALNDYKEEDIKYLFDRETNMSKFDTMCNIFKLPPDLKKYLRGRMVKFNPNFALKFNAGAEVRKIEKEELGGIDIKIEKTIKEIKPNIEAEVRRLFNESGTDTPELERPDDFMREVQNRLDGQLRIMFPKHYGIIPTEMGFIKDEQVEQVIALINQGRQLERQDLDEGEVEE